MKARHFDTLQYTKGAEKVGIPREQAEYQAQTIANLVNGELVTKTDLQAAVQELRAEIKELAVDFHKSLTNTVFSLIGAMAAIQAIFHFIK